jgi:flagellar hook-length control protein FliK
MIAGGGLGAALPLISTAPETPSSEWPGGSACFGALLAVAEFPILDPAPAGFPDLPAETAEPRDASDASPDALVDAGLWVLLAWPAPPVLPMDVASANGSPAAALRIEADRAIGTTAPQDEPQVAVSTETTVTALAGLPDPSTQFSPAMSPVELVSAAIAPPVAPHSPDAPRIPIHHPDAPRQVAEQLVWRIEEQIQEVQIDLHPEELGPVAIRMKLEGERVQLQFHLAEESVRPVFEASLGTLTTLLSGRGLVLEQAQIFGRANPAARGEPLPEGRRRETAPSERSRRSARVGLFDRYV